jgi:hypothetical protein
MYLLRPSLRWTACLAALALATAAGCASEPETATTEPAVESSEPQFVSIFNGQDLTGWRIDHHADDAAVAESVFTVENGELIVNAPGTESDVWLTLDRVLTDFALRLEFVAYDDARGNAGIQFHDEYVDNRYPRHGFDLASNVPESTGFIWDYQEAWLPYPMQGYESENFLSYLPEGWTYKWSTDPDPWNTLEVSVVGSTVRSVLNGLEIINWDGGDTILPSGYTAFQTHGGQVFRFKFRNIELADLSM